MLVGDQYQLHTQKYLGSTSHVWFGFMVNQLVDMPNVFDLRLGDAAFRPDNVSDENSTEVTWNKGYLILSFVYWP